MLVLSTHLSVYFAALVRSQTGRNQVIVTSPKRVKPFHLYIYACSDSALSLNYSIREVLDNSQNTRYAPIKKPIQSNQVCQIQRKNAFKTPDKNAQSQLYNHARSSSTFPTMEFSLDTSNFTVTRRSQRPSQNLNRIRWQQANRCNDGKLPPKCQSSYEPEIKISC